MSLARVRTVAVVAVLSGACSEVEVIPRERNDDDDPVSVSTASASSNTVTTTITTGSGAGGSGGDGAGGMGGEGGGPPAQVPGIVAVGWGGLRIVSRDDGLTWGDRVLGRVDGSDLLFAVAWGNGRWVAVGSGMVTSVDGVSWTDDTASMPCFLSSGVVFFQGQFWMGCPKRDGAVVTYRSADGLTWGNETSLAGGSDWPWINLLASEELMVAFDSAGSTYGSTNGLRWDPLLDLDSPSFCDNEWKEASECGPDENGSSWHDGTWLAAQSPGKFLRSTDGINYSEVYDDPDGHTAFDSRGFARGYVAP